MNYHDRPEHSSSQIADFMDDPIAWWHIHKAKEWPKKPPTPQMKYGTDVHRMIELGGPDKIVRMIPESVLNSQGHCKGKAWTDWKHVQLSENPYLTFLKPGELNPFQITWEHLQANRFARESIEQGQLEIKHYWTDPNSGLKCRMMVDCLRPHVCVDWKSTRSTNIRDFQNDAFARHYDVRLAFYQRGIADLTGETIPVSTVAFRNQPGYDVRPIHLSDKWILDAQDVLSRTLEQIASFEIGNYLDRPVVELDAPRYANFIHEYELETA